MKKFYIPFFVKFVLILILVSILPLIIISIQTARINRDAIQTLHLEYHTKIVSNISTKIQQFLEQISSLLPLVEEIIVDQSLTWDDKQRFLQTLIDKNKDIVSISILDLNGKEKTKIYNPELDPEPVLKNFLTEPAFVQLKTTNLQTSFSKVYFKNNISRLDVFYRKEKFYICVTLSFNRLFEELQTEYVGKTGFVTILDSETKDIVFTNARNTLLANMLQKNPVTEIATKSLTIGSKEFKENNIEYIASYISLPIIKWTTILQQEKNEAYASTIAMTKQATKLIIIAIVISIFISFFIATGISNPILKIVDAARNVAKGNFNVKTKIKTYDELELLGETFNHMAEKLNEYAEIQLDKLIAEKTKTEAIIFSIQDGIILTDYNGEMLLINNKAKNILGLQNQNIENQNIFNFLDESFRQVLQKVITQPGKLVELDLSTKTYPRIYQTYATQVTTLKGEKIGLVTVLHDITLEKEIDKMKDDFLHSITHDLRNPMTSLRGFIKFLSDGTAGPLNEQQKKMLEIMDRASFRLLGMINDILDIAKIEAGRLELKLDQCDLIKIIKSVIEIEQPQFERKKLTVIFPNSTQEIIATVDAQLIERVYTNLIGNAIKFTPENGTITIHIEEQEDKIFSYIQDTGEGIPPEYITSIFEKFTQVKNKSKGGTGLGLTICKYVIEAHKGKIWAESELGKGAKFIFFIPKTPVS